MESGLTEKLKIRLPTFTKYEQAQAIENAKVFEAILEVLGPGADKKFHDYVVRSVRDILQSRETPEAPTGSAATKAIVDPS